MVELPPAHENLIGKIGNDNHKCLNLLILGESSVAGVGVTNHADGIVGNIAKHLHGATGRAVHWHVLAKTGYTAEMVRKKLIIKIPEKRIDIIVVGLGANDAFHLYSPKRWEKSLCALLMRIRTKYPTTPIVIANLPPVGQFPAFPFLMRNVLGILIHLFGKMTKTIPAKFSNVHFIDKKIRIKDWLSAANTTKTTDLFADGVHPSATAYKLWGEEVGKFIVERNILEKS